MSPPKWFKWIAVLDAYTCDVCREMDSVIMNKPTIPHICENDRVDCRCVLEEISPAVLSSAVVKDK